MNQEQIFQNQKQLKKSKTKINLHTNRIEDKNHNFYHEIHEIGCLGSLFPSLGFSFH